ncbi:hypothetical protein [Paenibacillus kandeliae]|uniref:hypothetical protein n=1 Tax=Paenibacillus kandeliae TaxID=3231269 RepID=UPI00345A8DB7
MKTRNIAFLSALTLTAAFITAPFGTSSTVSAAAPPENTTSAISVTAASDFPDHAGPVQIVSNPNNGGKTGLLFLHGNLEIEINPSRYGTYNVTIFDNQNNPISNLVYSGSSPYTLFKSDFNIRGYHYVQVTSSTGAGSFTVHY